MQFEGVVSVLKPPGMTSSDVVVDIRRIFGERRVGHTGTLDPAAAGVLPICIGRATRLFDYLVDKEKEYIAEIRFGAETDTEDACGTVIAESSRMVSKAELEKILPDFIGEIEQVPPIYSSLSVNGVKMYKLARSGSVTAPAEERRRRIRVFLLETICELEQNSLLIRIRCSKGTYVRSLCRDIGLALGCCAYMPFLLRTASGTFDISEAHTIAELKELKEAGELQSVVVPVDEAARHLPELRLFNLSEKQRTLISNGASVECGQAEPGTVYRLYLENEFMGLALRDDSGLHITVWFGKEK